MGHPTKGGQSAKKVTTQGGVQFHSIIGPVFKLRLSLSLLISI